MTAKDSGALADALFREAQRQIAAQRRIENRRTGIGCRVMPGSLDIERLVRAGSLTTRADDGRADFRDVGE